MNFLSKIKSGLKNPKKGIMYIILGEKNFNTLNSHYCFSISPKTVLEQQMKQPTDIHEHLQTLYMLSIELNLKTVLELGTRTGESTITLLLATKELGGTMTSVDVDSCLEAKEKIKKLELEKYWNFIQSDDISLNWNTTIDHLFIDTSHTYDHTLAELRKFEPFVRKGGLITLHDIMSCPPVLDAINDFLVEREDFRFYKFFHNNGLGILKKI
jgi:predicted O-methyltransferase YrrM